MLFYKNANYICRVHARSIIEKKCYSPCAEPHHADGICIGWLLWPASLASCHTLQQDWWLIGSCVLRGGTGGHSADLILFLSMHA